MELDHFLRLNIQGLIALDDRLYVRNDNYEGLINVLGAVYISNKQIEAEHWDFGQMNIVADPEKAAIEVWSATGLDRRWMPAAGAFFKRIVRP